MYESIDLEQLRQDNPQEVPKISFGHQRDAFGKLSVLFTFRAQNADLR